MNFVWFYEAFCVCQHLFFIKYSCSTTKIFCVIFHLFTSISIFWTLSLSKTDELLALHSLKIFNFNLSLKTLRPRWHFNLSIDIKSCARKRLVLFNSQPSTRLTHYLGSIVTYPNILPYLVICASFGIILRLEDFNTVSTIV